MNKPETTTRPKQGEIVPEVPTEEMIQRLARTVTHPEFQKLIREIEERPEAERRAFAECVATPEEFAKRGIPVEEGFRVTTRYFEAPNASSTTLTKIYDEPTGKRPVGLRRGTLCVSVGFIVCVSYGDEIALA